MKIDFRYAKLNAAIVGLVEDFSLVTFLPLSIKNKQLLLAVRAAADKANGYVFGTGEERTVQALMACAMGVPMTAENLEIGEAASEPPNDSDQLLWK